MTIRLCDTELLGTEFSPCEQPVAPGGVRAVQLDQSVCGPYDYGINVVDLVEVASDRVRDAIKALDA